MFEHWLSTYNLEWKQYQYERIYYDKRGIIFVSFLQKTNIFFL